MPDVSEEQTLNQNQSLQPDFDLEEKPQPLTTAEAMVGVFTEPGNTFYTISKTPRKSYWILPFIISIVIGIIATLIFRSDSELMDKVMDEQLKKIEERFEKDVKSGKMTREQADITLEQTQKFMDPNNPIMIITMLVVPIFVQIAVFFLLSLLYMLALRIFKGEFLYVNILNVLGLAMLISAIGSLLATFLSILLGEISSVGLAAVFKKETVGEFLNTLFLKLDFITIWYFAVVSVGLSKIGNVKYSATFPVVFGLWILYVLISSSVSLVF